MDTENVTRIYLDIIAKMDLGYASDLASFRELVRADELVDTIPSLEGRRLFFQRALLISSGDAFVYQQFGIMEMRHQNFEQAETYLSTATQLEPRNHAYKHSYANLLFRQSRSAENAFQSLKLFQRAEGIIDDLIRWNPTNSYAYATYAEALIARSKIDNPSEKSSYLERANDTVSLGLRRSPDRAYLYSVQAQIFQELGQSKEAVEALFESHSADPTSARTALLLGSTLYNQNDFERAERITTETLKYNPNHERLNFLAAKIVHSLTPNDHTRIIGMLKKAFDNEYVDAEPNFMLAAQLFCAENYSEAAEIFDNFKIRKIYKAVNKSMKITEYITEDNGQRRRFTGEVKVLYESKFGFINADLIPIEIYFIPPRNLRLKQGSRLGFEIGFRYFGPNADNIQVL